MLNFDNLAFTLLPLPISNIHSWFHHHTLTNSSIQTHNIFSSGGINPDGSSSGTEMSPGWYDIVLGR
jgi:hypothetical protein